MVNNITTIFKENYHYSFNVPLNRFWTSVCYYFIFLAFLMAAILTQVGIHNRLDFPRNCILVPKLLTWLQRICYSHWANGVQNGMISIGQQGVFNH